MPSTRATSSACAKCRSSRRATASVSTWRICASCPVTPPTVSLPSTRKSSRMTRTNRHVHHMQPHFSPHFYSMRFSLTSLPSLALVLLLAWLQVQGLLRDVPGSLPEQDEWHHSAPLAALVQSLALRTHCRGIRLLLFFSFKHYSIFE